MYRALDICLRGQKEIKEKGYTNHRYDSSYMCRGKLVRRCLTCQRIRYRRWYNNKKKTDEDLDRLATRMLENEAYT